MQPIIPHAVSTQLLVVEDDVDTRATLIALLEREGFTVTGAANGAEAIIALEEGLSPAVVLADLHMPGMVGHELLEYMRGVPRLSEIPVAVITAAPHQAPPGYHVFKKPAAFKPVLEFVRACMPSPAA